MRSLRFLLLTCGLLPGQGNLPDGPGKEALQKACASCHEIDAVIASRRTRIGWQLSVDDMISRGAEGSDAEMAAIVEYLSQHFGKVNVNTASAEELEKTLSLSAREAQAIYVYREKNGKVKDLEELKKIPGVNPEQLQAKRGLIAFSQ
jgi:competence ComEA-like helix-hairpin-helix protein